MVRSSAIHRHAALAGDGRDLRRQVAAKRQSRRDTPAACELQWTYVACPCRCRRPAGGSFGTPSTLRTASDRRL
jgi:hypothetical protein